MRQPSDNPPSLPIHHSQCKQPRDNAQGIHDDGVAIDPFSADMQCSLHSEVGRIGDGQEQTQQSLKKEGMGEGEGGGRLLLL